MPPQKSRYALAQRTQKIVFGIATVNQFRPELVEPVEKRAIYQLLRSAPRRNAQEIAEVRAKLTQWQTAADAAAEQLATPPIGVAALDQLQARAKQFAEAQSRSFGLLLKMLANDAIPDAAAWAALSNARRSANELWQGVRGK